MSRLVVVRSVLAVALLSGCPSAERPVVAMPNLDIPHLDGGATVEPSTSGVRFGRVAPAVGARGRLGVGS